MTRSVDDYLNLPYHISLVRDEDDAGNSGWVARVVELPGCLAQGASPNEAVSRAREAMEAWISVALEGEEPIPTPQKEGRASGRLLLRMPRGLHAELAGEAESQGVSLNQLIVTLLAGAVRWGGAGHVAQSHADADRAARGDILAAVDERLDVNFAQVRKHLFRLQKDLEVRMGDGRERAEYIQNSLDTYSSSVGESLRRLEGALKKGSQAPDRRSTGGRGHRGAAKR